MIEIVVLTGGAGITFLELSSRHYRNMGSVRICSLCVHDNMMTGVH